MNRPRTLAKLCAFFLGLGVVAQVSAEEVFNSFAFQNHAHEQDGYTNGLFFARTRIASSGETGVAPPLLLKPLFGWLGVSDPTLASTSIAQTMITPRDLDVVPAPDAVPYAGVLVLRSASVHVRDNIADLLALDLGVMGPASGAEHMQRFIHRVLGATKPESWDTQGPSRALIGIQGYRAWRSDWNLEGNADLDFIALGGGTLGNRESSVGGTLMLRYGTDLARSFPTVVRVSGRTADPFVIGRGWFAYAGVSADRIVGDRWLGDDARNNITEPRKSQVAPMLGFAYGWENSSLSFSLHTATPIVEETEYRQNYFSITYVWRGK